MKVPIVERLVATGLLILLAASCSSASESVPTTSTAYSAPVTGATKQPGPELARILSSLAAGYPCEHVEVASGFVLADGAIDEAMADCDGESLNIAVFPAAEQADQYGRQGGGPHVAGEGWVIVTETPTLAERIADALGGTAG